MPRSRLPSLFDGLTEVRAALTADLDGRLLEESADAPPAGERRARAAATALTGLAAAGSVFGLNHLEMLFVKGTLRATVAAVRPEAFLLVDVDPSQRTSQVEKVLSAWTPPSRPRPPAQPVAPPALPRLATSRARPTPTPVPGTAPAPLLDAPPDDPWAGLRRSLVWGHLTEAAARQRALAEAPPEDSDRPGSEPLGRAELDGAMQLLVEGIGSVMAGDTIGGSRSLRDLAVPAQRNLSVRWLALHWSARAALGSDSLVLARQHVKEALAVSRQLDVAARAVSQLVAAELLGRAGDHEKALAWLAEARSRFDRAGDSWGRGQAWLAEARILAQTDGAGGADVEERCAEAARRAGEVDPAWDGPRIFLACRALLRADLSTAEEILQGVGTPAADRVRKLIDAIRESTLSPTDARDFLRVHHAPPTAEVIRVLQRIAGSSPGFFQAREALGWALLKLGRYADAGDIFVALMAQQLAPADRAVVMLGLTCVANARKSEEAPGARQAPAAAAHGAAANGFSGARPAPRLADSSTRLRSVPAGIDGPDTVFSGRLAVFSLPDLIEFLRSARRTGLLVFSSAAGMGAMRFREGWITDATSPGTPGVGELLVRTGKLGAERLRAVAASSAADQPDPALGERLVREGLVEAASVQEALRHQIELTLRELLQWKDGEFAFSREGDGDVEAPATEAAVQVDAQTLLLHLFKEMDETARDLAPLDPPA